MAESKLPNKESSKEAIKPESIQKCLQAFMAMGMDENGKIHKDNAKVYYQMTVGALYDEEMAKLLVDHMTADENGVIDEEGVMKPFDLNHWPREVLSGVCDLLENSPEIQNTYKSNLAKVLNLSEEEVEGLTHHGCRGAAEYLRQLLEKTPPGTEATELDLMEAFKKKCHLVAGTSATEAKATEEEPSLAETVTEPPKEKHPKKGAAASIKSEIRTTGKAETKTPTQPETVTKTKAK